MGVETVALRYFNVFGPRQDPLSQYAAAVLNFVTAALRGERPVVFGDGEQSRDFTHVDNVVEANLLAMDRDVPGGSVYNERITLNRLLESLGGIAGRPIEPEYTEPPPGDVRNSQADIGLIERELGFRPSVSLEEGLRRTVAYYQRLARRSTASGVNATGPTRAYEA
jgi:UDP-glucose 4-epimerase